MAEKGGRKWVPRGQGGWWQGPDSSLPRQPVGRWNRQFCPGKRGPRAVSAAESEPGWESWAWSLLQEMVGVCGGLGGTYCGCSRVAAARPRPGLGTRWPRGRSRLRSVSTLPLQSLAESADGRPWALLWEAPLSVDFPRAQGPLLCIWSKTRLFLEVRL